MLPGIEGSLRWTYFLLSNPVASLVVGGAVFATKESLRVRMCNRPGFATSSKDPSLSHRASLNKR